MRCRPLYLLTALGLTLLWGQGVGRADELPDFLQRLEKVGNATRTLTAKFVQAKQMALFRTEVKTNGRLLYRRPDQLRWETIPPDPSLLLVRGKQATLRLPGEPPKRMDLSRGGVMAALVEQMLTWLGARPAQALTRDYAVKLERQGERTALLLEPRQEELRKKISSLRLELDEALLLLRVVVKQTDGDTTVISFSEVKRNGPLPEDAFR